MDDGLLINGRGYGGCSILWKSTLNAKVTPILMHSNRVCAVQISIGLTNIIVFNVYMPCDTGANSGMYSEILQEIMAKCVELGSSNIIVGGDMNTNLQRVNSDFTRQLKLLCEVDSFIPCIDFVDSKIKYTFTSPVDHGTHTIDHLLVNDGLFNSVLEYYSLHEGTNLSFHSPIILMLHINVEYSSCHTTTNIPKPKWQESTIHDLCEYANALDKALRETQIPWEALQCCDKSCTMHYSELQLFHDAIVKACVESGKECIAHTSKSGKTSALTGWNEFVKPYRDDSIFWHNIWKQCGSPRNAVVADVMRRARKEYHNSVRALRLDQHQLHRQKVSQALLANKSSDFWKEIRKVKGNGDTLPSVIDNMSNDEDISDLFAKKYDHLYNSVSFDQNNMSILKDKIDELIDETPNAYPHVSVDDVVRGIAQTKRNKTDSKSILCTDHFINSNLQLRVFLSMLFSALIVHGFTPNDFNEATIFPLIKKQTEICQ